MSRTGLHRPRRTRPASQRPAPDTRLLHSPFPHPNTHNKRCPKAQRLDLRSDQSLPRPSNGRFPDKSRHALSEGRQVSAPLKRRKGFAPSGDATEHSVKLFPWAIAPFSDSPGVYLADLSEQSDTLRLKTIAPYMDSTVVTIGKLRSTNAGHGSTLPSPRVVEHFRWSRLPQSENLSRLVHVLSGVWGKDSTVVTLGELPTTNGGHGSTLPSLRVVEHFRWSRLPQSENFSRLVHVPSEVWGCRRVDAGVDRPQGRTPRIGTGVADILHKPSGTFHPHPSPSVIPAEAGRRCAYGVNPSLRNNHLQPHNSPRPPSVIPPPPPWEGHIKNVEDPPLEGTAFLICQLFLREVGLGSPLSVGAIGGSPSSCPPPHAKSPENPFRRRSIKTATSSINVQSTFNQTGASSPAPPSPPPRR